MKKGRLKGFLWILASIIEWVNILLFLAAMGDYRITFGWYRSLMEYEHIAIVYYISAAIDMWLFSRLVRISQKERNLKDMLIALFCFAVQVFLLIWKIKL